MFKNLFRIIFSDFFLEKKTKHRVFLIDLARFTAIFLMIIYHFIYDLNFFKIIDVNLQKGFLFILPRIIVTLFLFSSAMSFGLKSWADLSYIERLKKLSPRIIKLFFFALGISIVTRLIFPNNWVYFGTLHCFLVCTIFSIAFIDKPKISLAFGSFIILNYIFKIIPIEDPLSFKNFKSVDFIPIYPWFGVFLVGIFLSKLMKDSNFLSKSKVNDNPIFKIIIFASQKTLPIYLLHQIILFSLVALVKKIFLS